MEVINKNSNIRLVLIEKAPFKIHQKYFPKSYFHWVKKVDSFDEMKKAIIRTYGIIHEKEMTKLHNYYERIPEFFIIIDSSEMHKKKITDISGTLIPIYDCIKM